jgi:hypothetical protein
VVRFLALAAAGSVALAGPGIPGAHSDPDPLVQAAQDVRPAVVRIQWRAKGPSPAVEVRNAVVVDAAGHLLMSGPPPDVSGTLTATVTGTSSSSGQQTAPATVVAADERTALTLLWVPLHGLAEVSFFETPAPPRPSLEEKPPKLPKPPPDPLPPGTSVVMVTGSGAIARGALRGHERRRSLVTTSGRVREVSGLEEASMVAVAEDLGSPWIDASGRVVGLLVGGAVVESTSEPSAPGTLRAEPVAAHAVSARTARIVWPLLRTHRLVPRSKLGVETEEVSEAVEAQVCKCGGGREILDVEKESPADGLGLLPHDVLVAIDGVLLRRGRLLGDALLAHRPGAVVVLDLVRKGEPMRLEAVLVAKRSDD